MRIDIITLFPEMFAPVLGESIIGRAQKSGAVEIHTHQLRDYALDKHRRVDDTPYGGGMGMLMKAEPIALCFEAICAETGVRPHFVYMSPQGKTLRQQRLREFCHQHNDYADYEPLMGKMNDEEMANLALTLCHQTDKMMCSYIERLEERFVKEGGIKERMYAARTGYRQQQDDRLKALEAENSRLKAENLALRKRIEELEGGRGSRES